MAGTAGLPLAGRTGGIDADEMLRVFNCGIGMALVVSDPDAATTMLRQQGEQVSRIGVVQAAKGPASVAIDPPSDWLA